jgi:uncharacterized protein YjiS (DUF1127 family)
MKLFESFQTSGQALMQLDYGNRQFGAAVAQAPGKLRRAFTAWRSEQRRRRQVVRELNAYSDRELLDLGFSRADFPAILSGTYRR